MSALDLLLEGNRRYGAAFDRGDLPVPPARRLAVVACMDARLHVEPALGLELGDVHVIRNAGGRVSDDAIRSLIISTRLLGTNAVAVIHHTDCGMQTFTNEDLRSRLRVEEGVDAWSIDFLPFADLDESVREDVRRIRSSPYVARGVETRGFV
ncbi:MAG TPA: carbonic anhydrase, partial [Actinomycetota bacterium]|nr:carbonic anhydrase [Actinomycetota bacterium]